MGREVRLVPGDWQHPAKDDGSFIPLLDGAHYGVDVEDEDRDAPPDPGDYMPRWTDEEADHLMMYENTSEGTPISPAFKTAEELARWLADNGASAFGPMKATYEQWLATIHQGGAVSAIIAGGVMTSGVAFARKED